MCIQIVISIVAIFLVCDCSGVLNNENCYKLKNCIYQSNNDFNFCGRLRDLEWCSDKYRDTCNDTNVLTLHDENIAKLRINCPNQVQVSVVESKQGCFNLDKCLDESNYQLSSCSIATEMQWCLDTYRDTCNEIVYLESLDEEIQYNKEPCPKKDVSGNKDCYVLDYCLDEADGFHSICSLANEWQMCIEKWGYTCNDKGYLAYWVTKIVSTKEICSNTYITEVKGKEDCYVLDNCLQQSDYYYSLCSLANEWQWCYEEYSDTCYDYEYLISWDKKIQSTRKNCLSKGTHESCYELENCLDLYFAYFSSCALADGLKSCYDEYRDNCDDADILKFEKEHLEQLRIPCSSEGENKTSLTT